jgi:hypothetical protein
VGFGLCNKIGINEAIDEFHLTKNQKKRLLFVEGKNTGQLNKAVYHLVNVRNILQIGMEEDRLTFLKNLLENEENKDRYGVDMNTFEKDGNSLLLTYAMDSIVDPGYYRIRHFECAYYLIKQGAKMTNTKKLTDLLSKRYIEESEGNNDEQNRGNDRVNKAITALRYKIDPSLKPKGRGGKRNTTKRSNSKRKTKRHFKKAKSRKYRL